MIIESVQVKPLDCNWYWYHIPVSVFWPLIQTGRRKSHSVLFLHSTLPNPNLNIKLRLTGINYSLSLDAETLFQEFFFIRKFTALFKGLLLELEYTLYMLFLCINFFLQLLEMQPLYCFVSTLIFVISKGCSVLLINHFWNVLVCQSM